MPKLDWKKKDEKKAQRSEDSQDSDEFDVLESLNNPIINSSEFNNGISKNNIIIYQRAIKKHSELVNCLPFIGLFYVCSKVLRSTIVI